MTYRPVDNPSGKGRKSLPIPPTLIANLRHTYDTGMQATASIDGIPPEDVAEFRRALIRAGYRYFSDQSVRYRIDEQAQTLTYWLTDKRTAKPTSRTRRKRR